MSIIEQRQAAARRYGQIMTSAAQRQVTYDAGMANAPVIACSEDDTLDWVATRAKARGGALVGVAVWRTHHADIELMRLIVEDEQSPRRPDVHTNSFKMSGEVTIGMLMDSQPGKPIPNSLEEAPITWGHLASA